MASRIYASEDNGGRYEIAALPTHERGITNLVISPVNGAPIYDALVHSRELHQAQFTGRMVQFAKDAMLQYRVVSNGLAARIGFLFAFLDGEEPRTVMVGNDAMDWLLNPELDED